MAQKKGITAPEWVKSARQCCQERRAAIGENEYQRAAEAAAQRMVTSLEISAQEQTKENTE